MKTSVSQIVQASCCFVAASALLTGCYYKPTEVHQPEPGLSASVTTYSPGYVVNTLPAGYTTRVVGGTTYYVHHGTYFRPSARGYVVVESP